MAELGAEMLSRLPKVWQAVAVVIVSFLTGVGADAAGARIIGAPDQLDSLTAQFVAFDSVAQRAFDNYDMVVGLDTRVAGVEQSQAEVIRLLKSLDLRMCILLAKGDPLKIDECATR